MGDLATAGPGGPAQADAISLFQQQTSGGEDGRGVIPRHRAGKGRPHRLPAASRGHCPDPDPLGRGRPDAPRCGTGCGARARRGGLTFLAAERRVPGEREEGAQAEEQQRQEGAIAEPHLLGCAAGAGGAEAAWPGRPGPGRGIRGRRGPRPRGRERWGPGPGGVGVGSSGALGAERGHWALLRGWARPGWTGLGGESRGPAWIRGRRGVGDAGRGGPDLKGPQHPRLQPAARGGGAGTSLRLRRGAPAWASVFGAAGRPGSGLR